MKNTELTGVVAEHIAAVNAFDLDAIMATFADDAYVNDARREFVGIVAVRRWVEREMVGDHVTIEVREILEHHGDIIVRGAYDGTFDRTSLPDEIVLSNYFSVRDGEIVSLVVIFNQKDSHFARLESSNLHLSSDVFASRHIGDIRCVGDITPQPGHVKCWPAE